MKIHVCNPVLCECGEAATKRLQFELVETKDVYLDFKCDTCHATWKENWETTLPDFPAPIAEEHRNCEISVNA